MHDVLHKSRCLFNMHSLYNPYTLANCIRRCEAGLINKTLILQLVLVNNSGLVSFFFLRRKHEQVHQV